MFRFIGYAAIILSAATLATHTAAFAQAIPGSADINRIPEEQRRQPPAYVAPQARIQDAAPPIPAMAVPEGAEKIIFRLRSIELSGVTAYKPGELGTLWQPSLGKDISLLTLYQIAAAITAKYQNDGYVLSRAFVPAQEIGDGFARISVVEGYLAEVQFSGHAPQSRILEQARRALMSKRPLNIKFLERQMLLLNDLSGVDFKSVLKPLDVPTAPHRSSPRLLKPGAPVARAEDSCGYRVTAVMNSLQPRTGIRETGRVIFVSTGGQAADAVARRLQAAGAELDRCLILKPGQQPQIRDALRRGAALVVMDPINPRFGGDVARVLAPLAEMASRNRASILAVRSPGQRYTAPQPPPHREPGLPPGQDGGVLLEIVGKKMDPLKMTLAIDNSSSRFVGPWIAKSRLDIFPEGLPYQATGLQANSEATFKELTDLSVSHTVPLSAEGVVMELQAGYIRGKPGFTLAPNQVKSATQRLAATVSWDAVRQRDENLNLSLGLDVQDSRTDLLGGLLTEDKVRQARLTAHYDKQDQYAGATVVDVTLSQGLEMLGSSKAGDSDLSRAAGRPDFTKLEASAYRFQSLSPSWNAVFGVSGQVANTPLLSGQEFGYGGQVFGRAYDPSEIVGDRGMAARAEIRYDGYKPHEGKLQPFAFVDIGKVWNLDTGQPKAESAASAGAGVRYAHPSGIATAVTVAQPLIREADAPQYGDGTAPRVIFSLTSEFTPPADFFAKR